ncbi:MAG: hypothetical protein HC802_20940, partial [Caldilineaceae bacterium]|nr:hypothetical protein [Caldilineaceae bacterium]
MAATCSTNLADAGGGVYVLKSGFTFQNNVVTGNGKQLASASGDGGGLYLADTPAAGLVIQSNYFGFGQSPRGAAIYARLRSNETAFLRHNTIAHHATGSVILAQANSKLAFEDSIIAFNSDPQAIVIGVGARAESGASAPAVSLNRTLWYQNGANTDGSAAVTTANDFSGDPAFMDDGYHIKRISAAYGKGDAGASIPDRDGDLRPIGANRDLGADEYAKAQVVRYVAAGAGGDTPCTNYLSPCPWIQTAVDASNAGDLIKVAGGSYTRLNQKNGTTQVIYLDRSVSIEGGYYARTDTNTATEGLFSDYDWEAPHAAETPTIVNPAGQGRALYVNGVGVNPSLSLLTLTN